MHSPSSRGTSETARAVLAHFPTAKPNGTGWTVRCPAHDDQHASLSIGEGDDGRVLLHCHAGCSLDAILAAIGLTRADIGPTTRAPRSAIVAEYLYRDERGTALYTVVRFAPKAFRQRRADGEWSMAGVRRVLYRLPELRGSETVYVVEGEKDADRLAAIGLPATTNPGGAGKWRVDYVAQLKAAGVRQVIVLPDTDVPGRQHAARVAVTCAERGLSVKVVGLPDLPPKGDVSDWLETGHTREELLGCIEATPLWPATAPSLKSLPAASWAATDATTVDPLSLARALDQVRRFLRRFVVLSDHQATAIALWVAHTHAIAAAECTPYLHIWSATKGSGKTRLLELLQWLVALAWLTGRTTRAALVRKIDADKPTLLLDESDTAFNGNKEYAEELRGVLNSGYRRSGRSTACSGQGSRMFVRDFETFCPKAIAGIGRLPDTVADRAIAIALKKKRTDEPCERMRERDVRRAAGPISEAVAAAVLPRVNTLREARPVLPPALSDRQADVWEPLLAIAEAAGDEWTRDGRAAAEVLSGSVAVEDETIGVQLLADCREVFRSAGNPEAMFSKTLRERLCALEDRPWSSWGKAQTNISGQAIAALLRPFGVVSAGTLRIGEATGKGYRRASFEDPWARYCPIDPSHGNKPNNDGPESTLLNRHAERLVTDGKSRVSPITRGPCDDVTDRNPDHEDDDAPLHF
jgi:hypothetical protein